MSRPLSARAALLIIALVSLAIGPQVQAACTAANPNGNMIESTPTSAFTDNGNGTVTHALTGLMWKQCPQGLSGAGCATGTAATMIWSDALTSAVADRTAGYSDWRLPNKKELESILEFCGYNPAINQSVFPATPWPYYFSSATSAYQEPSAVWGVRFDYGTSSINCKSCPNYYVRLVRGGQPVDSFDATGLIFANGFD